MKEPVYIVTGASSGIGRAVTERLSTSDKKVIALGRNEASLHAITSNSNDKFTFFRVDLLDRTQIESFCRGIESSDVTIAGLIHCAGTIIPGLVADISAADIDRMFGVNTIAPILLTSRLNPFFSQTGGHIIFINSSAAMSPGPDRAVYSASKGALKSFADCSRHELNGKGIAVTTIYPGRTATPMMETVLAYEKRDLDQQELLDPAIIADTVLKILDLPGDAEMTDIHIRPRKQIKQ